MEESDTMEEGISESDDMALSEAEDLALSDNEYKLSMDEGILLNIDSNGRIATKEVKCENNGDDCDTRFVDKNLLGHRGSDAGWCTSTEDLNISDEETSCSASACQSVNLDGVICSSASKNVSLSTLNYSRTVLKNGNAATPEHESDDKAGYNSNEIFFSKDRKKAFPPGLTVAGLSSPTSLLLPSQKPLNTLNIPNVYANSLLLDEALHDLHDEQESMPMTCLEFLKSEISDDNNTDAEDISVGSTEDIGEKRNPYENGPKSSSIPVSFGSLLSGTFEPGSDKRLSYPGDSRRSSVAEFHTDDEELSLENFSDRCRKRVKKRNFIVTDKNRVSDDSGTDEELLEDQ